MHGTRWPPAPRIPIVGQQTMVQHRSHIRPVRLPPAFDLLALHRANPARYPCLLESVDQGSAGGRHDILFGFPGDALVLGADRVLRGGPARVGGFLDALDAAWHGEREAVEATAGEAAVFRGGWFLFMGYELRDETEPSAAAPVMGSEPVAIALRVPAAVVRERRSGEAWIVDETGELEAAIRADIAALFDAPPVLVPHDTLLATPMQEPDPASFLSAVDAALRHIAAGDIFQANLTRAWQGTLRAGVTPADVYARLRLTNPAPFAGLATFDGFAIASSSPERLVRVRHGTVETRPIAGTRARTGAHDEARRRLLTSPKEQAEHVMLIDLERNDLGRVCIPGSINVNEFMAIETYSHVHHIVSNVRGTLRPEVTPGQLIRAVFPGGTITGCPKVRCMSIIADLERRPRGAYTGAMGYLNRDGSCDLNILIRSIVITGRDCALAAGSGIVADSSPARELDETRAKARGMLLALGG